jgi:hypothetical protein
MALMPVEYGLESLTAMLGLATPAHLVTLAGKAEHLGGSAVT